METTIKLDIEFKEFLRNNKIKSETFQDTIKRLINSPNRQQCTGYSNKEVNTTQCTENKPAVFYSIPELKIPFELEIELTKRLRKFIDTRKE